MIDHYATLGISTNATGEEIRKAWRRAAQRFHPDATHNPTTSALFLKAKEAYEILSDPARRAAYDKTLEAGRRKQRMGTPEAYTIKDLPWIREDSLILTYVKDDGQRMILNTPALHLYLNTIPRPIRLSVLNRLSELVDSRYIYGVMVSDDMFVVMAQRSWVEAGKIHSLHTPWNEGFWEPDYQEKTRRRHVWTTTNVDPRVKYDESKETSRTSTEKRSTQTASGRTSTPPPPPDERFRRETVRTTPPASSPTETISSPMEEFLSNLSIIFGLVLTVFAIKSILPLAPPAWLESTPKVILMALSIMLGCIFSVHVAITLVIGFFRGLGRLLHSEKG